MSPGQPNRPPSGTVLGPLADIADGEGREFVFGEGEHTYRMFVVRRGRHAWGYVNRCPHFRVPLNHRPDRFVNSARTLIMCSQHTATFRFEDGYCVAGPCEGDRLEPVGIICAHGQLIVA